MKISLTSLRPSGALLAPSLLAAAMVATLVPADAQAKCSIGCAFRHVSKPIKAAGDKGINFASAQGKTLASMTVDEFNTVKSGTNQVINESAAGLESGYNAGINAMASFMDDYLMRQLRNNATSFLNNNQAAITKVNVSADKLSDQARAALKRLSKVLPSKQVTAGAMADMQLIAKEMGFNELFSSVANSSWGIGINGDAGAGLAGANSGLALVLDVRPDKNGNLNGAIVTSVGGSVGIDLGVSGSISIFWQPGLAQESTGLGIGFGMSLESAAGGGGIGWSWPISVNPNDYASVMNYVKSRVSTMVPGFTVSVDIPGAVVTEFKGSYDLNVGWSQVVAKFTIDPGNICQFVTSSVNGLTQTKVASGSSCPGASSDSK